MNETRFEVSVRTSQDTSVTFKLYNKDFEKIGKIASKSFSNSTLLIFNVSKEVHFIKPYVRTIDTKDKLWFGPFKDTVIKGLEVKPNKELYTMGSVYSHDFQQWTNQKKILN
jgi:hypothetical protein